MIRNETMKYFNEKYDVRNMTQSEWESKLDIDYIRKCGGDDFVLHSLRGWNVVKKMLEEYNNQEKTFDGQIKWGQPLAQLELPSMRNYDEPKTIYCPPVCPSYESYKENIALQQSDDIKSEKKKEN